MAGNMLESSSTNNNTSSSQFGKFVFRSQIDCKSDKLGGYFDIKTRATFPIRMDVGNYHKYTSYRIKCIEGKSHSWTREYNDMVRSLFIKWSLQGRLGFMKGMFVWYHSTQSTLGFQYIPLESIHEQVFGSVAVADDAFRLGFKVMERFFDDLVDRFPGKVCRYFTDLIF